MYQIQELKEPDCPEIDNLLLLQGGQGIDDIDKLQLFSDKQFEKIVGQWAFGYLKDKYTNIHVGGGAGDQGIDVLCHYDLEKTNSDIYQCKHYKNPIQPNEIYIEIGKLLYYSYKDKYKIPLNYYIVASKGCGSKLKRLIDNPESFKKEVIRNWKSYCENKISSAHTIKLDGDFSHYVKNFNFSIIKDLPILEFLEQFEKTKYYSFWFGLKRHIRPKPPKPEKEVQNEELEYVEKLFTAYGSFDNRQIKNKFDLYPQHLEHLEIQRENFYHAEGLKLFSRDYLPQNELYADIQDQVLKPVKAQLLVTKYKDGLECLNNAINLASSITIGNNSLSIFITSNDRIGMLHQKANEDINFKWVNNYGN